ncbi:FMN reductase [NAD(P)H] [Evansella vedderi]|uniref:FMN reductase [NAD(P)H] n=1 Tax=Evansella vedderi TaxID=38282 RepID=A0ABT9ZRU5_9BACI|nr:NADPH-dependent oxidoreductase [Evansella vedderi]MDQ0253952.1 FMN reductase [NAD(P)H] [Evansella vedderi]
MNEVINLLQNHRSFREYKADPVTDEQLETIVTSAMAAANWINGQQVTVIEVQDKPKKAKLAKLVGNQAYVDEAPVFLVFCIDYYRAKLAAEKNNTTIKVTDSVEALLTGATDVGIALGNAIAAAESMGLGTVPIGGIRKNPLDVIKLLDLPEYVFPISGLVVGHPKNDSATKPRLPLEAVYHKEQYHKENLEYLINQYDETMENYIRERTNGAQSRNWSSGVANFYSNAYKGFLDVSSALKKQGFHND